MVWFGLVGLGWVGFGHNLIYTLSVIMLSAAMLTVNMPSVVMLIVILMSSAMASVTLARVMVLICIVLSVVVLHVVMANVVEPKFAILLDTLFSINKYQILILTKKANFTRGHHNEVAGKSYRRGKLSTVRLLVLTSPQLPLILE